jgi:predicted RNase H-like HicB family nuclease
MRQAFQLNAQVQWAVVRDEAAQRWVAICDPMGITVEADSHTELRENITDAMNLMLVNLLRSGELDHFLKARGWQAHPLIEQVEESDSDTPFFDVPIELVAQRANDPASRIY